MNKVRVLIIIFGFIVAALVLQFLVYGSNFTYESVSNVLFVAGVLIFFPSLVVVTGSYEVFYAFRYSSGMLFSRGFRKEYPSFVEYRDIKLKRYETSLFYELIVISLIVIIVAAVLAGKV